jgi:hypothetical protein
MCLHVALYRGSDVSDSRTAIKIAGWLDMTPYSLEMGTNVSDDRYCVCIFLSHACYILRLSNPPSYEHSNDWWKVHSRDLSSK